MIVVTNDKEIAVRMVGKLRMRNSVLITNVAQGLRPVALSLIAPGFRFVLRIS